MDGKNNSSLDNILEKDFIFGGLPSFAKSFAVMTYLFLIVSRTPLDLLPRLSFHES